MPIDTLLMEVVPNRGLAAFSLKDEPALIERVFPAQKVGIEAQKERKAGPGQTLTSLGSYWKGRKPLVLVRACVLASLLPATGDPDGDLDLFETLMRMDFEGITRRSPKVTAAHVWACDAIPSAEKECHLAITNCAAAEDGVGVKREKNLLMAGRQNANTLWKLVDLGRFDEAERNATELGRARLRQAELESKTLEERLAAVAHAAQENKVELERVRSERYAERSRVKAERRNLELRTLAAMSFGQQVAISERVEKVEEIRNPEDLLYNGVWERVNARLGTDAGSLPELVEQLGIARFGHRPVVGDPFAGGGSIPFEAARIGCDVVASDLNPVAAMLSWGAINIIGADAAARERFSKEQSRIFEALNLEITRLGIEHNARGDRAKAFLYCIEVVDPQTGWRVPMAPSWVISRSRGCIGRLAPDYSRKRFHILLEHGVSAEKMRAAETGTVQDGHLVYRLALMPGTEEREWRIPISRLRGSDEGPERIRGRSNLLRPWEVTDVVPREPKWIPDAKSVRFESGSGAWMGGDIWLERLYAIQWIDCTDIKEGKTRPRTWFAAPDADDLNREAAALQMVMKSLADWQDRGLVPDMRIEHGHNTTQPIRERGWTYWHHLFTPRHLILGSIVRSLVADSQACFVMFGDMLNRMSRLSRWETGAAGPKGGPMDRAKDVFSNQALNTFYNYAARGSIGFSRSEYPSFPFECTNLVRVRAAAETNQQCCIWIYDPPYSDAVNYHEITEFFIAWLRKDPPPPFSGWTWDSKRPLAIQGKGDKFRSDMVAAFRAMVDHMPDNGIQVCMFTHQDAGVWADMAQIVWGAGLRVTAAWYVSTETTSEQKKGGYVQGTVLMVLRKRAGDERGYRDEIVLEVRAAVQRQVELLTGLNQCAKTRLPDESPFSDADIQMAGYAAALEVLTGYTHIEGTDMTREALRPRVKDEKGIVEEMIALAVQTATELMRPDGIQEGLWERLVPTERFWLKMMEAEANRLVSQPCGKLDDYQNFAKAYRADGWDDLMADKTPNKARLKGAADFKRAMMSGHPFSEGLVRPVLYAINELRIAAEKEEDAQISGDRAITGLRDNLTSWGQQRLQATLIAEWLGRTLTRHRPEEATAARTLAALIRTERLD